MGGASKRRCAPAPEWGSLISTTSTTSKTSVSMKTQPDRYIKVGTINTRYWDEGQGQPVLLIHGIGSYIENWLPGFESLAQKYHVYAVDLPGHGRTDKSLNTPCEIADLAHFVNEFMRPSASSAPMWSGIR